MFECLFKNIFVGWSIEMAMASSEGEIFQGSRSSHDSGLHPIWRDPIQCDVCCSHCFEKIESGSNIANKRWDLLGTFEMAWLVQSGTSIGLVLQYNLYRKTIILMVTLKNMHAWRFENDYYTYICLCISLYRRSWEVGGDIMLKGHASLDLFLATYHHISVVLHFLIE